MQETQSSPLYPTLQRKFKEYLKRFQEADGRFSDPIKLKVAHTHRVVREIRHLSEIYACKEVSTDTAQCTALLHDIGRFEQYLSFGTYDDRISLNHAALSVVIIDQSELLSHHNERERHLIRLAIKLHNSEAVTQNLQPDEAILTHMIRDADKLDIWRLIIDRDKNGTIDNDFSYSNFELVSNLKCVPYAEAKTKADMRLFRIGWVFDVYFVETMRAILTRGYVKQMFAKLPRTKEFIDLQGTIESFLLRRVQEPEFTGRL